MTWRENAACRDEDTELFFGWDAEEAKAICRSCAVRFQCLQYAVDRRITEGVFGGFTALERSRRYPQGSPSARPAFGDTPRPA